VRGAPACGPSRARRCAGAVGGLADPQLPGHIAEQQYDLSVEAALAQARAFAARGYDVAVDDVLTPEGFARFWLPRLDGLDWRLLVVLPSLAKTLDRWQARDKRVMEHHTRAQHAAVSGWPAERVIDTSGLDVAGSVRLLEARLRGG
jgi:hypothetical protein